MAYEKPEFSINQVNKAGTQITNLGLPDDEFLQGWNVVENWRVAHRYPLNALHMTLRNRARQIDKKALTAQRLKRMDSILRKLFRKQTKTMNLTQMQDIGGCRAVVDNVVRLNRLLWEYETKPLRSELSNKRDYVETPKQDGYRSVHLMYRYSGRATSSHWDKLRIELQLRTKLQHAWATAVETVDAFTGEYLKFGAGSYEWRRFFALVGAAHARQEKTAQVPSTPHSETELVGELVHLEKSLRVIDRLDQYASLTTHLARSKRNARDWYLIDMKPVEGTSTVYTYPLTDFHKAKEDLSRKEQEYRDSRNQVVLVSAASVTELKRAYPNYFADTNFFSNNLKKFIGLELG